MAPPFDSSRVLQKLKAVNNHAKTLPIPEKKELNAINTRVEKGQPLRMWEADIIEAMYDARVPNKTIAESVFAPYRKVHDTDPPPLQNNPTTTPQPVDKEFGGGALTDGKSKAKKKGKGTGKK